MFRGLVTAFRTLTIFPVPGRDASDHSTTLPFFPLVGLALGFFLWAIGLINRVLSGGGWPAGVAALMLVLSVVGTRSLHLDGLADFADALGGGWDRTRRLEIMKDSSLGVFGAVAVILTLLCKWLAFSRLLTAGSAIWVILVLMISRTMQVELMVRLTYARGEGTASLFVQNAKGSQLAAALVITLFAAIFYGPLGLFILALAEAMTWIYGTWCRKHMGGITGDLLGACNEIIEVVLLVLVAAPGGVVMNYTGWGWMVG
ncbi:MAG: adenosylcobinamide-GDP ribazoletransferase [Syntrophobacterales bacterium]